MQIGVLGVVEVHRDGELVNIGGSRQRRLLALLVLHRGHPVPIDRLVEAMWPDGEPPKAAEHSTRTYLSRLRAVLANGAITTQRAGYALETDSVDIDIDCFDSLISAAESAVPDRAVALYDEALGLWRGDPFGELTCEWWALPESSRLQVMRTSAELGRAAGQIALGHHHRAIADLERLTRELPHDERAVTLLMNALRQTGRSAEALRVGRSFRQRLAEDTGLDPSPGLSALETAVVAGADPASDVGRPLRGYTIHHAIGEGAHGRVYAGTQPGTDRPVAIKAIRPDIADSNPFIVRFEAEARLVARLEHPHIVPLYDFWREPGGAYLVFRLLSGGTAKESVVSGGQWSLPRVSRLVEEVGGALIAAHAAGVVHHDVTTSNVFLDEDGAAYLGDFGIATPAAGSGDGSADVGGDVRDFGCLLWELLTGSVATAERASDASLVGHVTAPPPGLDGVLRRAVSGEYASVAELVLGWRAATDGTGTRTPITSGERVAVDAKRRGEAQQLARSAAAGTNPYRGLRPFDEATATDFHGRRRAVTDLVDLLAEQRWVTVTGASGSGKSSVVQAGLVPRMRATGVAVLTMVPGDDPVGALRAALTEVATSTDVDRSGVSVDALADVARALGGLVLVVDQFEECWTRAQPDLRDRFLEVVTDAVDDDLANVRVIATIRADLLDRPLDHSAVGDRVSAGLYALAPLTPAEIAEAIIEPAARVGVGVDSGVVPDLVSEAASQPGSLPLLQFTLAELYDRRVDGMIGRDGLDALGGMAGAVGRRAERLFAGLDDEGQLAARALFGRLVSPGGDRPDTRRRVRLSELSPAMRDVADAYVGARLLVGDRDPTSREPTIEVGHEALLTRWERLDAWIAEDRRWLDQLQHLARAARSWDESGRTPTELYRGTRLEAAIEAIDVEARPVSETEHAFVEAGREARDADVVAARHTARRLRRRLAAVAIALVAALVGGAIAVVQRQDAQSAQGVAEAATRTARIEALVGRAESLRETQRDAAALLTIEAFRLSDTPRTRSALLSTFTDEPRFYDTHRLPGETGGAGIVMPDGVSAYSVDLEGRLRPYGLDDGSLGKALPAVGTASDRSAVLVASRDGGLIAQASRVDLEDGPTEVGIFDTGTATLRFAPIVVDGTVWSAAFTADGARLALAIGEEARLVVIDSATGEEIASSPGVTVPPVDYAVAPEPAATSAGRTLWRSPAVAISGRYVVVASTDGSLRMFDADTFELSRTIAIPSETSSAIWPLDDGTLLTAGRRAIARVDLTTGKDVWRHDQSDSLTGDAASAAICSRIVVVDEGGTFFCGNAYGRLAEHDLTSGVAVGALDTQNGNIGTLWSARGGTELVTFGDNEAVVSRWRLDGSGPITRLVAPGFNGWTFNPAGDLLLVERGELFGDAFTKVVDAATGTEVRSIDRLFNADWIDDDTVGGAIVRGDGRVEMARLDLPEGDLAASGLIIDPVPNEAYLWPGTQRVLMVYRDGPDATVREFDPTTQRYGPPIEIDGFLMAAISRSGDRIAAGTDSGIFIYDSVTGEQVGAIPGPQLRGVFITVTDQLFVSSLGGELTQYDLETLDPIREFGGSRGHIRRLNGTADGTLIATHGGDKRVILYDVATGVRLGTPITIPDDHSDHMSLSIDGRWLTVGGEPALGNRANRIWDLDAERWAEAACNVAGRNLSRQEWAATIGDLAPYRLTCPDLPVVD